MFLVPSILGTMKTSEKILQYIDDHDQASGKELSDFLDISDRAVRKQLRSLLDDKKVSKIGTPPRVYYALVPQKEITTATRDIVIVDQKIKKIIDENFLFISPRGERIDGWEGFVMWCDKRDFAVAQQAQEYVHIYQKYSAMKKDDIISGKVKMNNVFGDALCLEDVYYADFYAWEIFGKTKRGQFLLYAKQSQEKKLMREVAQSVQNIIVKLIQKNNIDAVGFIPPTVKRQVQFMKILQEALAIPLPVIDLVKVHADIPRPQKTLNKLPDRIENADSTIIVAEKKQYNNILLIDDAVGSGATLNQVACKLKKVNIAKSVYGFAIVGSAKGFDVISEV